VTASRGIRAKRSDAGQVRLSERDAAVLRFLGEQFGAPLSVVAELYGVGDRVARRHVARLERAGFAGRLTVAGQQWVVPTRAGLRFADLDHEVSPPRAWKLEHVEGVARLRLALTHLYPGGSWTSEANHGLHTSLPSGNPAPGRPGRSLAGPAATWPSTASRVLRIPSGRPKGALDPPAVQSARDDASPGSGEEPSPPSQRPRRR
jgi:hypothetical protein